MTYSEFCYLWNARAVQKNNAVRLRDITNIMPVTRVSVFLAMERLEKAGFVQKNKDRKIYFTDKGRTFLDEYEKAIYFLKDKLLKHAGIGQAAAEEEAMRLVCVLSNESRKMLVRAWQKQKGEV